MIVKNELLGYPRYIIYQDPAMFNFSLDSILLADFVRIKKGVKNIIDLGSGNGAILIYLTLKTNAQLYGIEIIKKSYELGLKSIKENLLDKQITTINDDILNARSLFANDFDAVVCNPPFFKYLPTSNVNKNDYLTIARHEVKITLEQIIAVSFSLLKNGGSLFLIHRPERLVDILLLLEKNRLEPKRIRFVYPKENSKANHVLIEATKLGKAGNVKVLKPLYVYNNGKWTDEVLNMYNLGR